MAARRRDVADGMERLDTVTVLDRGNPDAALVGITDHRRLEAEIARCKAKLDCRSANAPGVVDIAGQIDLHVARPDQIGQVPDRPVPNAVAQVDQQPRRGPVGEGLVGSEMCIRDSLNIMQHCEALRRVLRHARKFPFPFRRPERRR